MAGRASIVGAAATHVGKVREHNEDAHYFDADKGIFVVCDGMGGHAAGEVASELAIRSVRAAWGSDETQRLAEVCQETGTPEAKRELLATVRAGAVAAHEAIVAAAAADNAKSGMGTTLIGALVVGNELVFAQAGDSRAYLVRDKIAMQLTEDHTLLARLLSAGIEVDVTGDGSRFRSMLTNALGIGQECKVTTFVVPLADGDRFLLCSDGISEYVPEAEVGTVLTTQPSPARAAQKLIELALERGGGDNATAVVVRVLEAGERPQPAEMVIKDEQTIASSPLWGRRMTPQQRLRALRIAIPRDLAPGEQLPAHFLGGRVCWIVVDGELELDRHRLRAGACVYPESLVGTSPLPDRDGIAVATTDVRALALRADDVRELCEDDTELGEVLMEAVAQLLEAQGVRSTAADRIESSRPHTSSDPIDPPPPVGPPLPITLPADPPTWPKADFDGPTLPRAPALSTPDAIDPPTVPKPPSPQSLLDPPTVPRRSPVESMKDIDVEGPTLPQRQSPFAGKPPPAAPGFGASTPVARKPTPPSGMPSVPPVSARAPTPAVGVPILPPLARTPPTGIPTVGRAATPPSGVPLSPAAKAGSPLPAVAPVRRTGPQQIVTIPPSAPKAAPPPDVSRPPEPPPEPPTEPPTRRARRISEGWDEEE